MMTKRPSFSSYPHFLDVYKDVAMETLPEAILVLLTSTQMQGELPYTFKPVTPIEKPWEGNIEKQIAPQ